MAAAVHSKATKTDILGGRPMTEREAAAFRDRLRVLTEDAYAKMLAVGNKRHADMLRFACEQAAAGNMEPAKGLVRIKRCVPVTIDEFLQSPDFFGACEMDVWPALLDDIRLANPDVFTGAEPVHEALIGGATGTGKTTFGLATNGYQGYLFTCFEQPQKLFGIAPQTTITFPFQADSLTTARERIYKPFRQMWTAMPYAKKHAQWKRDKESALELLDGNIVFAPVQASLGGTIGGAIPGAIVDEVNFMTITENSKKASGPEGGGGRYDQAAEVYTNLSRRRSGRFETNGFSMGVLCISSSTRYKDDFLDQRIDEVNRLGLKGILTFRRKQYEMNPKFVGDKDRFNVLVGTENWPTRVLEDHEEPGKDYPAEARVESVPSKLKRFFLTDPENALRDIIGIATGAITPFIGQRDRIAAAMTAWREAGLKQWVGTEIFKLIGSADMPDIIAERLPEDRDSPRFVHVDLSISGDRCGIAVVRRTGLVPIGGEGGVQQMLPSYAVECAFALEPSKLHNVNISAVREWVLSLSEKHGVRIGGVSYDSFQSKESLQILRQAGVRARELSVDTSTEPYEYLRQAIYDGRVLMPDGDLLKSELSRLEWTKDKKKIDHPPKFSKDIADAVCAAIFNASQDPTLRAEIVAVSGGANVRVGGSGSRPSGARPAGTVRPQGSRTR